MFATKDAFSYWLRHSMPMKEDQYDLKQAAQRRDKALRNALNMAPIRHSESIAKGKKKAPKKKV